MDDVFSGFIVVILLVMMFVTGPIYNTFQTTEKATDNYVNVVTSRFQKEVRNNGYVDYDTYLKFRNDLLTTKRVYDVEMICERKDVFPVSSGYENHYVKNGTDQILKVIENKKKYEMNYGDNFTVLVKEKELSKFKILNMFLYGSSYSSKYVFAKYGGMVQNED